MSVVEDVGHHEVDAQAAMLQIDAAANGAVHHPAAMSLVLWRDDRIACLIDTADLVQAALIAVVRRVAQIDAVIPVTGQVNEPTTLMIAQFDARGSKWCAVLAHILHQSHILIVGTLCGVEVDDLGVAHVLGITDGTEELEVEG